MCSSCLTGALNIIGEKDNALRQCEEKVDDFKLLTSVVTKAKDGEKDAKAIESTPSQTYGNLEDDDERPSPLLPSAIGNASPGNGKRLFEVVQPLPPNYVAHEANISSQSNSSGSQPAVLRIDNVPWVRDFTRLYEDVF